MRENELKPYLLGQLSEPEQTHLETQLLSDHALYDHLLCAEAELQEAYLQGTLSPSERTQFERVFLAHPDRQLDLHLTKALCARAMTDSAAKDGWWEYLQQRFSSPVWKVAAAAAAAIVLLAVLWSLRFFAGKDDVSTIPSAPIAAGSVPVVGTKTQPVELASGQTMAGGEELIVVTIPPDVGQLQLKLGLRKDRYETYKASLQSYDPPARLELPGEHKRQTANGLSFLEIPLPVATLRNETYTLRLEGITASGTRERADHYTFKIKR